MTELDPLWTAYSHLQAQSRRRSRLDAVGWGLEAGLNHLLANSASNDNAAAAVAQGRAKEQYRARLRLRYCDPHQVDDPSARLDDADRLRRVIAKVIGEDRRILLAIGFGHDSAAVASIVARTPEGVRQRLARLRKAASAC